MEDPFSGLAGRYLASGETLRGIVRHTLLARQLGEHLSGPPARIADVGGGGGHQAIPLARRGYEVTILDPSRTMEGLWLGASTRPRARLVHDAIPFRLFVRLG
jgi:ubiquinone/menaquinone biosynthesis C-methylase UbiE